MVQGRQMRETEKQGESYIPPGGVGGQDLPEEGEGEVAHLAPRAPLAVELLPVHVLGLVRRRLVPWQLCTEGGQTIQLIGHNAKCVAGTPNC